MFGLVDCNNFFVSCERVFRPDLNGKPVIVLSNNDGCVIARSQEAKAIGIAMGDPYFKLEGKDNVIAFSSNQTLYGDMSQRVMNTLQSFVPKIEIYSIDEAFLDLSIVPDTEVVNFAQNLTKFVRRSTGIPVSLGIAPTKTLAKMASKYAKKYKGYRGVCMIDTPEKREKALKLFPVGDIWGIGDKYGQLLNYHGVKTAYDFIRKRESWVRCYMKVVGVRTWQELQGEPCFEFEFPSNKKSICTSRSFAEMLTDYSDIRVAVSNFAAACSRKLPEQNTAAGTLTIFLLTNQFRPDLPQYYQIKSIQLSVATNAASELITAARQVLELIYFKGYRYKKAGVIVSGIVSAREIQGNLFDQVDRNKQKRLFQVLDAINKKNGTNTLRMAAQGNGKKWQLKNEYISRRYTTNLDDIIEIR